MHLSSAQALLIGVAGVCTAGPLLAEAPAPPASTVREIEAEELFPLVHGESTFEVVDGDGEGRQVVLALRPTDGEGGWEVRFGDYNIHKLRNGSVLLTRQDVLTEGQAVLYEPPVVLLPHRIVLPITRERFVTPAGDYEGFLVPIEQIIDLESPAAIRLWIDCGFFPGKGLVKRSMKFVVDKPAWFGSTTRCTAEVVR